MATTFRCNLCNEKLTVDDAPGTRIECTSCGGTVTVPGVRSSSESPPPPPPPSPAPEQKGSDSPEQPPVSAQPATPQAESTPPEEAEAAQEGQLSAKTTKVLAVTMPWGVSVALHAGVFAILLFVFLTRAMLEEPEAEKVIIPDARLAEDPGALIEQMQKEVDLQENQSRRKAKKHEYRKAKTRNMLSETATKKKSGLKIIGIGAGGGGGPSAYGLSAGEGDGPKASFYGSGGNAYKIVYVIDRSGSFLDTFEYLRDELKRSIRALVPQQQFHVIFFSQGKPEEMPPKKLVYATEENKQKAFAYLDEVVPGGQTDPRPALERALKYEPELIYFMTDGEFEKTVLDRLRRLNKDAKVKINTYAFLNNVGEQLLRQIAQENGGRYTYVTEDDL